MFSTGGSTLSVEKMVLCKQGFVVGLWSNWGEVFERLSTLASGAALRPPNATQCPPRYALRTSSFTNSSCPVPVMRICPLTIT